MGCNWFVPERREKRGRLEDQNGSKWDQPVSKPGKSMSILGDMPVAYLVSNWASESRWMPFSVKLVSGTTRYPRVPRSSSTSSSFPSMEVEPIRGILGRAPSIFQPSLSPRSYFPISRIFNPKVPYLWLWPSGKKRKLSRKESEERDLRYLPSLFPLNSIVVGEGHECRIP